MSSGKNNVKMGRKQQENSRDRKIGPITKALTGIVKLPDDFDEKEFMSHVFAEKHGLKRIIVQPGELSPENGEITE